MLANKFSVFLWSDKGVLMAVSRPDMEDLRKEAALLIKQGFTLVKKTDLREMTEDEKVDHYRPECPEHKVPMALSNRTPNNCMYGWYCPHQGCRESTTRGWIGFTDLNGQTNTRQKKTR